MERTARPRHRREARRVTTRHPAEATARFPKSVFPLEELIGVDVDADGDGLGS
jgi:hypothetical protein